MMSALRGMKTNGSSRKQRMRRRPLLKKGSHKRRLKRGEATRIERPGNNVFALRDRRDNHNERKVKPSSVVESRRPDKVANPYELGAVGDGYVLGAQTTNELDQQFLNQHSVKGLDEEWDPDVESLSIDMYEDDSDFMIGPEQEQVKTRNRPGQVEEAFNFADGKDRAGRNGAPKGGVKGAAKARKGDIDIPSDRAYDEGDIPSDRAYDDFSKKAAKANKGGGPPIEGLDFAADPGAEAHAKEEIVEGWTSGWKTGVREKTIGRSRGQRKGNGHGEKPGGARAHLNDAATMFDENKYYPDGRGPQATYGQRAGDKNFGFNAEANARAYYQKNAATYGGGPEPGQMPDSYYGKGPEQGRDPEPEDSPESYYGRGPEPGGYAESLYGRGPETEAEEGSALKPLASGPGQRTGPRGRRWPPGRGNDPYSGASKPFAGDQQMGLGDGQFYSSVGGGKAREGQDPEVRDSARGFEASPPQGRDPQPGNPIARQHRNRPPETAKEEGTDLADPSEEGPEEEVQPMPSGSMTEKEPSTAGSMMEKDPSSEQGFLSGSDMMPVGELPPETTPGPPVMAQETPARLSKGVKGEKGGQTARKRPPTKKVESKTWVAPKKQIAEKANKGQKPVKEGKVKERKGENTKAPTVPMTMKKKNNRDAFPEGFPFKPESKWGKGVKKKGEAKDQGSQTGGYYTSTLDGRYRGPQPLEENPTNYINGVPTDYQESPGRTYARHRQRQKPRGYFYPPKKSKAQSSYEKIRLSGRLTKGGGKKGGKRP